MVSPQPDYYANSHGLPPYLANNYLSQIISDQ